MYPNRSTACCTLIRVSALMPGLLVSTFDTVLIATPASMAT
jgi:hypothetical protein